MQQNNLMNQRIAYSKLDTTFDLIWKVFQEFVALDYTQDGIKNFYTEYIRGEWFRDKFANGKEIMYGAYLDDDLVGVVSFSDKNTVSCIFVDGNYHRMGIGKKLFDTVIQEVQKRGAAEIKLNASSHAISFYHSIGFESIGEQSSYKGIVYTPMKYQIRNS